MSHFQSYDATFARIADLLFATSVKCHELLNHYGAFVNCNAVACLSNHDAVELLRNLPSLTPNLHDPWQQQ